MRTELVTTLKRKATALLSDLARDKEPIVITQPGLPSAHLVDVESYEALQDKRRMLEGIAHGERAAEERRTVSHQWARSNMARWLK